MKQSVENLKTNKEIMPNGQQQNAAINDGSIKTVKNRYHPLVSLFLALYGLLKLIYLRYGGMLFYPSDYSKTAAFVDGLFEKAGQEKKISTWQVLRRNLFTMEALVALAQERYQVIGAPYVGDVAPAGELYTLSGESTDLSTIFCQSSHSIHVLNFGSYS